MADCYKELVDIFLLGQLMAFSEECIIYKLYFLNFMMKSYKRACISSKWADMVKDS